MTGEWVGDDGRIVEPEPEEAPKPRMLFDQDDERVDTSWVNPEPEEWVPPGFASTERVDAIEQKLDKLIALLTPPEYESGTITVPPESAHAFPPGTEITMTDLRTGEQKTAYVADAAPVAEVRASAKVEALKAEQEARQQHGNMPPEEAVAQGLGITQPRPGPEDIEDGRGFRDKPAAADDPMGGV